MGDQCDLHAANGEPDRECQEAACPFWRVAEYVGDAPGEGCAIKYYQLIGNDGVAAWLLSVRERLSQLERSDEGGRSGLTL